MSVYTCLLIAGICDYGDYPEALLCHMMQFVLVKIIYTKCARNYGLFKGQTESNEAMFVSSVEVIQTNSSFKQWKKKRRQVKIYRSVILPCTTLARQNYSLEKNKVELNRIDFIFIVRKVNKLVGDPLTL